MKTLNKKILTGCLALMMCIVMAVPTFAAASESVSPRATLNGWHYYRPYTVLTRGWLSREVSVMALRSN